MTPSSVLAQTTKTSAMGALEIQVFAPRQLIAAIDLAWRASPSSPGSEPWSGSVRPKQPIHSPVASFGQVFALLRLRAECRRSAP